MNASQILQQLIAIENTIARYETRQKRISSMIGVRIADLQTLANDSKAQLNDLLKQSATTDKNGEPVLLIEGASVNYVMEYTKSRGAVKVVHPDAVPDEFCKIERKPKLKEIKEYIETTPVNWASIEFGEPQVTWKVRKK